MWSTIPVWGIADAGTIVKVTFNHETRTVETPTDGKWKVFFPPMKAANKAHTLQIDNEGKEVVFHNIIIG